MRRLAPTIGFPHSPSNLDEPRFEPRWYAVWTRSRHEKSVAEQVRRKAVEVFLPLYGTVRRWENGDHHVELPLFPGYAFVRISLRDRLSVLKVPGVVRLVGFNGTPIPLDDGEIESLRRALTAGIKAAPHPYLTVGRRVRITGGPLAGREGILMRRKGAGHVVLSLDLIQRSIFVVLKLDAIEPTAGRMGKGEEVLLLSRG
jgi:transcription antitermination factor NusG